MAITTNILNDDQRASVKTKLGSIFDYYYGSGTYTLTKWADARSLLNDLKSSVKIYDGDAASAVVADINVLNNLPDNPDLDLNFTADTYVTNGSASDFSSAIAYTTSGNKTMVDSDGLLKWAPHNLVLQSEDPSTWGGTLTVSSGATDPDGGNEAYTLTATASSQSWIRTASLPEGTYTRDIWVRRRAGSGNVRLYNLGGGQVITSITTSWQKFSLSASGGAGNRYVGVVIDTSGDEVDVWHPALYRSDLGGMVNNPDTGNSYVPTTTAAVYMPRRGHHVYNGTGWANEGLFVESEPRVNLALQSNQFDTAWTLSGGTITQDATGLDGETTAWTAESTSNSNYLQQGFTVATSTAYTFSVFAKAGTTDWLHLRNTSSFTTPSAGGVWFNLSSGVVGTENTGYSGVIEDVGNGWYRCSSTFTTDASDTTGDVRIVVAGSDGSALCTSGDSILIYGAQFEAGSTPSSYMPTSGSQFTRGAETLTIAAADLPYNSDGITIQMNGRMTYADEDLSTNVAFFRWGSVGNWIRWEVQTLGPNTGRLVLQQAENTVYDTVINDAFSPGVNVPHNIASRHASNAINGAVDGVSLTADTTPTALPDLSATNLSLAYDYMGTIDRFRMWGADFKDNGISDICSPSLEPSLSLTFDGSETSFTVSDWSA